MRPNRISTVIYICTSSVPVVIVRLHIECGFVLKYLTHAILLHCQPLSPQQDCRYNHTPVTCRLLSWQQPASWHDRYHFSLKRRVVVFVGSAVDCVLAIAIMLIIRAASFSSSSILSSSSHHPLILSSSPHHPLLIVSSFIIGSFHHSFIVVTGSLVIINVSKHFFWQFLFIDRRLCSQPTNCFSCHNHLSWSCETHAFITTWSKREG